MKTASRSDRLWLDRDSVAAWRLSVISIATVTQTSLPETREMTSRPCGSC